MPSCADRTILVTGATDGLGRGLAAKLAAEGAAVLIHGRDDARGRETVEQIRASTGNQRLHWYRADLGSLQQTRALADQLTREHDRLDALVNNAGIGTTTGGLARREESRDGYELRFAVNYLAGYLLTHRLISLLERSAPARIVNVASAGQAPIEFDDVMLEQRYDAVRAYCQSKLAQIMFTIDLAEELHDRDVTATCLHPASYMPTKIVRADGINPISSIEDGVSATLRLVAGPELAGVSGVYYNGLRPASPHPQAQDPRARRRLRELSDHLCGLGRTPEADRPEA
jgi:NAD(P)-dependent dehydrogenase (short-subunit alcohol dehydrogenase family)